MAERAADARRRAEALSAADESVVRRTTIQTHILAQSSRRLETSDMRMLRNAPLLESLGFSVMPNAGAADPHRPGKVSILADQPNVEEQANVADLADKKYNDGKAMLVTLPKNPARKLVVTKIELLKS